MKRLVVALALLAGVLAGCAQGPNAGGSRPDAAGDRPEAPVSAPAAGGAPGSVVPAGKGAVAGTVRDSAGKPVAGVLVQPRSLDEPARPVPELAVVTDEKGQYRWTLAPGRYAFVASLANRSSPQRTATLIGDQTVTLDLTLG